MRIVIIEDFNGIIELTRDEFGDVKVFNDMEHAIQEKEQLHNGTIVEL